MEMLSLGKLPSHPQCNSSILLGSVTKMTSFPAKALQTQLFSSSIRVSHLGFYGIFGQKSGGFWMCMSKGQRNGGNTVLEMEEFDQYDDFLEEEEEEEDEDLGEGDEDDEAFIPLNNMKKWLQNKPRGFGEGKVYDTSIEDKLMEEMEQSRRAQLANVNKLKNNPVELNSKKEQVQHKNGNFAVSGQYKDGYCVRLVNLPKKKNIHKDLQLAFKGVPGMVDIVPVVSGNKRTRDPICKGLAFVYFRSENDADRFVQKFSGQSVTFGKVQKQIKCEINIKPGCEQSVGETSYTAQLAVSSLESLEENITSQFKSEDEMCVSALQGDNEEYLKSRCLPDSKNGVSPETTGGSIFESSYLKQKVKLQEERKVASRRKKEKIPKMNNLGSANRLKIKEKALLMDAFSKYAANASSAVKEQS